MGRGQTETDMVAINERKQPTYIFYFIGDGMGASHRTLAEYYLQYKNEDTEQKLIMNTILVTGIVTSHSANSLLTDSAAGGTALATGEKMFFNRLAMSPDGTVKYKTLLEATKEKGLSTQQLNFITNIWRKL